MNDVSVLERRYRMIVEAGPLSRAHMYEYMPILRKIASGCDDVVEFGTGGADSTTAILLAQPKRFTTYDVKDHIVGAWDNGPIPPRELTDNPGITDFKFIKADTRNVEIGEVDFLFIDSDHSDGALRQELEKNGCKARRWLAFHDTVQCPWLADVALKEFCVAHPEWVACDRFTRSSFPGFLTLERRS